MKHSDAQRLLMDFALCYVRSYPGVNSHVGLVTLAPGRRGSGINTKKPS